jgi:hypothetical protein
MVGVTRLKVQETAAELEALLPKQSNPLLKERLQVLYWLQLPEAMSVSAVAKVIGAASQPCATLVERLWRRRTRPTVGSAAKSGTTESDARVGRDAFAKTLEPSGRVWQLSSGATVVVRNLGRGRSVRDRASSGAVSSGCKAQSSTSGSSPDRPRSPCSL